MTKRTIAAVSLALASLACDSDLGFVPPDPDTFVIQAFLFSGEPVTAVSVSGVLPVDADSTEVPALISDAQITLIEDGVRYDVVPTAGEAGTYNYPGTDLDVEVGDVFQLEVTYGNRSATAQTVVPSPPTGLFLSADSLIVPDFGGGRGGRGVGGGLLASGVTARWSNPSNELHFVVIDNVQLNPTILPTTEIFSRFAARIVQRPTAADSSTVALLTLTHFDNHRLKLYRINTEYADLYEGLNQDSRDLNEPPSNIRGALGVFSAFSADSASSTCAERRIVVPTRSAEPSPDRRSWPYAPAPKPRTGLRPTAAPESPRR